MKSLLTDIAFLLGAGLVVYGLDLIYRPLAVIVLGVLLVGGTFILSRGRRYGTRKRIG